MPILYDAAMASPVGPARRNEGSVTQGGSKHRPVHRRNLQLTHLRARCTAAVQEGLLSAAVGGVPQNNGMRRGGPAQQGGRRGGGRLGATHVSVGSGSL